MKDSFLRHAKASYRWYGALLQSMFGPTPLPSNDPDICRWEDDGGPCLPDPEPYTHSFTAGKPSTITNLRVETAMNEPIKVSFDSSEWLTGGTVETVTVDPLFNLTARDLRTIDKLDRQLESFITPNLIQHIRQAEDRAFVLGVSASFKPGCDGCSEETPGDCAYGDCLHSPRRKQLNKLSSLLWDAADVGRPLSGAIHYAWKAKISPELVEPLIGLADVHAALRLVDEWLRVDDIHKPDRNWTPVPGFSHLDQGDSPGWGRNHDGDLMECQHCQPYSAHEPKHCALLGKVCRCADDDSLFADELAKVDRPSTGKNGEDQA